MQEGNVTALTIAFVKKHLQGAESGHDWFHIERVWKNAKRIAESESGLDMQVVELAALLHDIADSKFHDGDEEIGPRVAFKFLCTLTDDSKLIDHVVKIIEHISFKGGHQSKEWSSKELEVVQDADRLDAIGAIGIARTFNFGGYKNNPIYDPSVPPNLSMSKETYKKATGTTINHFYEKLLLLKGLMNTATGKALAQERHDYMEGFLRQFYAEWNASK